MLFHVRDVDPVDGAVEPERCFVVIVERNGRPERDADVEALVGRKRDGTGHGHEFLSAVRVGTRGPVALLTTMFMDHNQRGIWNYSAHTGLLWALESLAWSDDHFAAAVNLLALLVDIDPGGRLANRPLRSLYEIFCPWSLQCSASPEARLQALDRLSRPSSRAGVEPGVGLTTS